MEREKGTDDREKEKGDRGCEPLVSKVVTFQVSHDISISAGM